MKRNPWFHFSHSWLDHTMQCRIVFALITVALCWSKYLYSARANKHFKMSFIRFEHSVKIVTDKNIDEQMSTMGCQYCVCSMKTSLKLLRIPRKAIDVVSISLLGTIFWSWFDSNHILQWRQNRKTFGTEVEVSCWMPEWALDVVVVKLSTKNLR